MSDSAAQGRGYVGPVAREITFDAQRDPMFQDEHGNGWVPLATYEERMDEIAELKKRLGYPEFAR